LRHSATNAIAAGHTSNESSLHRTLKLLLTGSVRDTRRLHTNNWRLLSVHFTRI